MELSERMAEILLWINKHGQVLITYTHFVTTLNALIRRNLVIPDPSHWYKNYCLTEKGLNAVNTILKKNKGRRKGRSLP